MVFLFSVFDINDDTVPSEFRNGFAFLDANKQVSNLVFGQSYMIDYIRLSCIKKPYLVLFNASD